AGGRIPQCRVRAEAKGMMQAYPSDAKPKPPSGHGGCVPQAVEQCSAPHIAPGSFGIVCGSAEFIEIGLADRRIALFHKSLVGDGLRLDVGHRGVAALTVVEIEQILLGLPFYDSCELVRQIDAVVDAAIHAHATDRVVDMSGIPGEQHAALPESCR